jgi:hypothetical protein
MKFVVLDDMKLQTVADEDDRRKNIHNTYGDRYHYLDQLLDKTFITDYFMDRARSAAGSAGSAADK